MTTAPAGSCASEACARGTASQCSSGLAVRSSVSSPCVKKLPTGAVPDSAEAVCESAEGQEGRDPPAGAKRIARILIDNENNKLFNASRDQLIEAFKSRVKSIDPGDVIEIQVRNGNGEIVIQASEILP